MSSYPTPLTPANIQGAMQLIAINALFNKNYNSPLQLLPAQVAAVRIGWQPQGQPAQLISEDITYLRCVEVDSPTNRQRDVQILPNPNDPDLEDPTTLLQIWTYQRVWQTYWTLIGPNSFDRARILKSSFFTQVLHDTFAALNLNLYLVPNIESPRRITELFSNQWWERTDFMTQFNEGVSEVQILEIAESVEVQVYESSAGKIADFTVPLPS